MSTLFPEKPPSRQSNALDTATVSNRSTRTEESAQEKRPERSEQRKEWSDASRLKLDEEEEASIPVCPLLRLLLSRARARAAYSRFLLSAAENARSVEWRCCGELAASRGKAKEAAFLPSTTTTKKSLGRPSFFCLCLGLGKTLARFFSFATASRPLPRKLKRKKSSRPTRTAKKGALIVMLSFCLAETEAAAVVFFLSLARSSRLPFLLSPLPRRSLSLLSLSFPCGESYFLIEDRVLLFWVFYGERIDTKHAASSEREKL